MFQQSSQSPSCVESHEHTSWFESHEHAHQFRGSCGKIRTHITVATPSGQAIKDLNKLHKSRQITRRFPYSTEKAVDQEISKLRERIRQFDAIKIKIKQQLQQTCRHEKWTYCEYTGDFVHYCRKCLRCGIDQTDYDKQYVKTSS